MEQMPNSEQNADVTTSAPTCHNTMLSASAVSSAEKVSNEAIAKISIVVGGFDVSVEIKENAKIQTVCPFISNLKEHEYSKI